MTETECEDGNRISNDGCSSECRIETGWDCTKNFPSVCSTYCGDGVLAGQEKCDFGY